MNALDNISATNITKLISAGEVSCRAVVQHFITKIEDLNPALNAVVVKLFKDALEQADKKDAAFLKGASLGKINGVPFTIKECLDLVGTPSTFGLLRRSQDFPKSTDTYVKALQHEGGIVLGKTNVSQLLASIESQNPVYGTTSNPYSKNHSSGGSSGGEGAIIAAGGSPIGLGTDIGGSVRIPAAFNGICAIKPSTNRTLDRSRIIKEPSILPIESVTGILANHAEDLHLFLDIMNNCQAHSNPVLKDYKQVDVSQLKVGYMLTDNIFEPSKSIQRGVLESVEKLNTLGAKTTLFKPPDLNKAEEIYTRILSSDQMPLFAENLQTDKPISLLKGYFMLVNSPNTVKNIIYHIAKLTGQSSLQRVVHYFKGEGAAYMKQLNIRMTKFTEKYELAMGNSVIGKLDAIICPVFPLPAILHNTAHKIGLGGTYTIQNNITGFPSGVATVSHVRENDGTTKRSTIDLVMRTATRIEKQSLGLPVGIQIFAKPWEEHLVIALIDKLHIPNANTL